MDRKFTLAGLKRVRDLQEEQAAALLAKANHRLHSAQAARDHAVTVLAAQSFPEDAIIGENLEWDIAEERTQAWRAIVAARASATALVRESTQVIHNAAADVDDATRAWAEAKMRAAMIEKLRDRHQHALVAEEMRGEQLVLDEAALRASQGGRQ